MGAGKGQFILHHFWIMSLQIQHCKRYFRIARQALRDGTTHFFTFKPVNSWKFTTALMDSEICVFRMKPVQCLHCTLLLLQVNLWKKSCTCYRKKICSHLLAVMLANDTDVDNIKGTKVEAFNIGALYRSQRPKRTGKKGPPLIRFSRKRSLSDLSKKHELHHNDADQFSNVQLSDVSSAEDSSSDDSSEEDILDVTLERSFSELPVLTTDHHMENVLNINGIHLCLCDLKSVTVGLPEEQHQYKWGQATKMIIPYKRDDGFWSMLVVKPADHIVLVLNSNGGTTDEKLLSQLLAYC
ncbi:unnamed protein product [Allacma fusca]|uniref:SWIM-type domain-containing protein n=1 Tax=Allacma fusca TaxID=39272 RepID=A0A8J2J7L6_9HEXA|nr:unnamed protein product [Allacma fusca]